MAGFFSLNDQWSMKQHLGYMLCLFGGRVRGLVKGLHGTTAIEYALIAGAVALAISVAVFLMGDEVFGLYDDVQTGLADQL